MLYPAELPAHIHGKMTVILWLKKMLGILAEDFSFLLVVKLQIVEKRFDLCRRFPRHVASEHDFVGIMAFEKLFHAGRGSAESGEACIEPYVFPAEMFQHILMVNSRREGKRSKILAISCGFA